MIDFVKGHGTGNDFVIVEDVDNARPLSREQIAALCHRHTGIGADGLLRVVRAAKHPDASELADEAEWFMDYYNADGSIAEMCGNGTRVFARYLQGRGLATGSSVPLATRAGLRTVTVSDDLFSVDMGPVLLGETTHARLAGSTFSGRQASMGNPHLVCKVADPDALDLLRTPVVETSVFPDGVNVEFIAPTADGIRMRVHERGVGETLSCGTGACAAAAVALDGHGELNVDVPGGRLTITIGDTATLTGPAALVAEGRTSLV